jgi:hypothetical protein
LSQWEKTFPTIEGRKIIIQWTIASMSQYLAAVQGMPLEVEQRLQKIGQAFIWDNEGRSTINQEAIMAPIKKGRKRKWST